MQATTSAPAPRPRLMTTKEAAERLGVSHRHMLDLMAEGSIPRVLVGRRAVRIDPQDLEEFIASRKGA